MYQINLNDMVLYKALTGMGGDEKEHDRMRRMETALL
jgi:hypothetical protein